MRFLSVFVLSYIKRLTKYSDMNVKFVSVFPAAAFQLLPPETFKVLGQKSHCMWCCDKLIIIWTIFHYRIHINLGDQLLLKTFFDKFNSENNLFLESSPIFDGPSFIDGIS